jgi:hypothetical protein
LVCFLCWDYSWINVSTSDLVLRTFRLLKPLGKIEEKGTKLKNAAMDFATHKNTSGFSFD